MTITSNSLSAVATESNTFIVVLQTNDNTLEICDELKIIRINMHKGNYFNYPDSSASDKIIELSRLGFDTIIVIETDMITTHTVNTQRYINCNYNAFYASFNPILSDDNGDIAVSRIHNIILITYENQSKLINDKIVSLFNDGYYAIHIQNPTNYEYGDYYGMSTDEYINNGFRIL